MFPGLVGTFSADSESHGDSPAVPVELREAPEQFSIRSPSNPNNQTRRPG